MALLGSHTVLVALRGQLRSFNLRVILFKRKDALIVPTMSYVPTEGNVLEVHKNSGKVQQENIKS